MQGGEGFTVWILTGDPPGTAQPSKAQAGVCEELQP